MLSELFYIIKNILVREICLILIILKRNTYVLLL